MAFTSYAESRPWAHAMKEMVFDRAMPPWPAAPGYGDFANDPTLTPFEAGLLAAWADGGAPNGNEGDLPTVPPSPLADRRGRPGSAFGRNTLICTAARRRSITRCAVAITPHANRGRCPSVSDSGRRGSAAHRHPRLRRPLSADLPLPSCDRFAEGHRHRRARTRVRLRDRSRDRYRFTSTVNGTVVTRSCRWNCAHSLYAPACGKITSKTTSDGRRSGSSAGGMTVDVLSQIVAHDHRWPRRRVRLQIPTGAPVAASVM